MANTNQDTQSPEPPVIEIVDLTKVYVMGTTEVHALSGVSLTVQAGEYVAIIGASGSGKSTLMNMIGLLDRPTSGSYRIRGVESSKLSKNRLADLRNREIGFVFQRFNLLARTTAQRQVELPLFYAGVPSSRSSKMAIEALARVGLGDRIHHKPDELSGGQQQRVAIARALVHHPSLLLADEPTGALDSRTGQEVLTLLDELHDQGMTLVVVTHDMGVANRAERIITLKDGEILSDRPNRGVSTGSASDSLISDSIPVVNGTGNGNHASPSTNGTQPHSMEPAEQHAQPRKSGPGELINESH